eukprot:TRINITY_DN33655_c0_g1_i1.p1 TRINITY_DN33655_c0_g1~~TRINITY_DN33655_c0_g1_i1.p1  ORF type:complete len:286 (+),score=72.97 TRINITY_DN33655_c0_g1_i1:56-913(+)
MTADTEVKPLGWGTTFKGMLLPFGHFALGFIQIFWLHKYWGQLLEHFGQHNFVMLVTAIGFSLVAPQLVGYTLIDLFHLEPWYQFKIQKRDVPFKDHVKAWKRLATVALETVPQVYLLSMLPGPEMTDPELIPSVPVVAFQVAICAILWEIPFYLSHRLLHIPALYRHIHKVHHEYETPISTMGVYAHWIEHQILVGPVVCTPYFMGFHMFVSVVWYFVGFTGIMGFHSGYTFPWHKMGQKHKLHDLHHELNTGNFGFFGGIDYLLGTHITDIEKEKERRRAKVE